MMVTFVSQCQKNALKKTRRVLDAFADRIGDNTWQTVITQEGLNTVKKMLRSTASKNTAVSCHWIRSRSRTELVWVVGNKAKFDREGRVPVNSTQRDLLISQFETNWYCKEDIKLLSQFAALLHDLGKSSVAFQKRLREKPRVKNLYRHEWVSLRLFLAFVGSDDDETWLRRMIDPTREDSQRWTQAGLYWRDGIDEAASAPFKNLSPLAAAIAWLVVTHHRLPVKPAFDENRQQQPLGKPTKGFSASHLPDLINTIEANWNEIELQAKAEDIGPYWEIEASAPFLLPKWSQRASKLAKKLWSRRQAISRTWFDDPYIMHLSRLTLMLADRHYSSLDPDSKARVKGDKEDQLYANTHNGNILKQTLTEHLLGVAALSGSIAHWLPLIEKGLPRLAGHRKLRQRSTHKNFLWQNKAADAATEIREASENNGAFIVNMASTGCGKTLANARILNALAKPEEGVRATFALGLRTLTLQTGRSYQNDLKLNEDELAIRVGGSANKKLFEYYEAQAENTGSASVQDLIEEDGYIEYEGLLEQQPFLSNILSSDQKIQQMIQAPFLVCTVDHLVPATEAQRGGRQIAPMLRLMSSDLVLDELDDFDINDLPALTRLVYWAGLLGTRVVISSATLPPDLVSGMYEAYLSGRHYYHQNRSTSNLQVTERLCIPCLWVDEFGAASKQCENLDTFVLQHQQFVDKRVTKLEQAIKKEGAKRQGKLLDLNLESNSLIDTAHEFADFLQTAIVQAHQDHHEICPVSNKRVSFGLVRMANIGPLYETARTLIEMDAPADTQLHVCVYHSQFPLILRSAIENQLDATLNRRKTNAVYNSTTIRTCIDNNNATNQIFVVVGSPVTEVGRDHDYDWAIVEPSSMRSLIQLAGRVQRHRQKTCDLPNIFILNKNLRHFYRGSHKPVFIKPGFEMDCNETSAPFRLNTHDLNQLLRTDEYEIISAKPRIQPQPKPLNAKGSLVDLEHSRMALTMRARKLSDKPQQRGVKPQGVELNAASCCLYPQASLTWVLPQHQPFRKSRPEETLLFLPDEEADTLTLHRIHEPAKRKTAAIYTQEDYRLHQVKLKPGQGVSLWGEYDLMTHLKQLASALGISLRTCAERFTIVNMPDSKEGWWFHPALGFSKNSSGKATF